MTQNRLHYVRCTSCVFLWQHNFLFCIRPLFFSSLGFVVSFLQKVIRIYTLSGQTFFLSRRRQQPRLGLFMRFFISPIFHVCVFGFLSLSLFPFPCLFGCVFGVSLVVKLQHFNTHSLHIALAIIPLIVYLTIFKLTRAIANALPINKNTAKFNSF